MNLLMMLRDEVRKLRVRVALMLARAALRGVDDSGATQLLQLEALKGEVRGDVEHFQPYGFKSVPPTGSHAAVAFQGGQREHGIAVVVQHAGSRPKNWSAGEAGLFTDEGVALRLKRGRIAELTQDELTITVDSLTIDAGGSTLVMDASGVTITAPQFTVVSPSVDFDPS